MPTFRVISPLERNGERHEIGASIELDTATAEPLLGHTLEGPLAEPDTVAARPRRASVRQPARKSTKKTVAKKVAAKRASPEPPIDSGGPSGISQ
jgi:hypothetical protein